MPLHLNLFHEIEQQRAASRRDPLKLSLYALAAIGLVLAAIYSVEMGRAASVKGEFARAQANFRKIEVQAKEAKEHEATFRETIESSDKVIAKIEGRFYWAPVLSEIAAVVPPEVQITKLSGNSQGFELKKAAITLDGVSAGTDPRRVAEDLRQSLIEVFSKKYKAVDAGFQKLEEGSGAATLNGESLPTALFTINVKFQTDEDPPPKPVIADRNKKNAK
jgi:Tfp pilus assembly protein PilN